VSSPRALLRRLLSCQRRVELRHARPAVSAIARNRLAPRGRWRRVHHRATPAPSPAGAPHAAAACTRTNTSRGCTWREEAGGGGTRQGRPRTSRLRRTPPRTDDTQCPTSSRLFHRRRLHSRRLHSRRSLTCPPRAVACPAGSWACVQSRRCVQGWRCVPAWRCVPPRWHDCRHLPQAPGRCVQGWRCVRAWICQLERAALAWAEVWRRP
jgi:hypothetical protein